MLRQDVMGLTDDQRQHFSREGYVMVPDVFADEDLAPVMAEIEDNVDQLARAAFANGKLSSDFATQDFEHRLARINEEDPRIAESMWGPEPALPSFFHLMRTPRLLRIACDLCGEELVASSVYRLRPKVPTHVMSQVPWHQDSGYFEPYCDSSLVLTVWLPLVNATEENGCMWVLPRGHRVGKVVSHRQAKDQPYLEIESQDLPAGEPRCVPVPKGGVLLMTNLTPHASFANRTDRVRWSMDLRYQSATLPSNAAFTRLPGETPVEPPEGVPVACYPPEADFLVHSIKRPREVIQTGEEFVELRKVHVKRPLTNRFDGRWK